MDDIPKSSRDDLDVLLETLSAVADRVIRWTGRFAPFAAVMAIGGRIEHLGSYLGRRASTIEHRDLLVEAIRSMGRSGTIRAAGVVTSVRVPRPDGSGKTKAARISLEHIDGSAVDVFLPYRRKGLRLVRGSSFSTPGRSEILG